MDTALTNAVGSARAGQAAAGRAKSNFDGRASAVAAGRPKLLPTVGLVVLMSTVGAAIARPAPGATPTPSGAPAAAPAAPAGDAAAARAMVALDKARATYEIAMEGVRKSVRERLDKELEKAAAAKKSKDAVPQVDAAKAKLEAFETSGAIDALTDAAALQKRYAQAAKVLADAYVDAEAATAKGDRELSDAVSSEYEVFGSHNDLNPWGKNLVPTPLTLAPGGKPASVEVPTATGYRLQIAGSVVRRDDQAAAPTDAAAPVVTLRVPLPGGKQITIPARAGKDGKVLVLLTVTASAVAADLGAVRPIDIAKAEASAEKVLRLSALGETLTIERVQVKPIVEGAPPEVPDQAEAKAKVPPKPPAPAAGGGNGQPQDLLRTGAALRGNVVTRHNNESVLDAEIIRLTADRLVLETRRTGNAGQRVEWVFERSGNSLTLKDMTPKGGTGRFRVNSGSGKIEGDSISFNARFERINTKGGADVENNRYKLKKE